MNHLRSSISGFGMLAVVLAMSGCGSGFVNAVTTPPATTPSPVTPHGASEGLGVQDYGGHAPLVGAHIYLVQLGAPTSSVTQTYGTVVKNLLTIAGKYTSQPVYSGTPPMPYTYPLSTNVNDQFVPATDLVGQPFKYVTTNQYGESYITGDYACDPGYPVMFIGYGGSPSYNGAGPNTFTVASESATAVSGGTNFTFTTTAPQLFYTGEPVTVSGNSAGNSAYNVTGTVLATGLTSTSFTIMTTATGVAAATTPIGTVTATGTPAFNPAAVNMAVLGLCPTSGNFSTPGNGAINYVYMNEVSTTAAAYALAGFIDTTQTNQTGNDEFHIGAPTANLAGLQNAAVTAGLLYDIQGGNISNSGGFVGENHTARVTTPCPATGTCAVGTVPNTQINTIANSLAACVDSNNTYKAGVGTISTACATLDKYATDNGYYDTTGSSTHIAFNIAQAAFNIARFPQGLGTATTSGGVQTLTPGTATTASAFTTAIYGLPAGANVPFQPQLSAAPNDFAVGIAWSDAAANSGNATVVRSLESDIAGNLWATGPTNVVGGGAATNTVFSLSPSGAYTSYTGALPGGAQVALDTSTPSNAYVPGSQGTGSFFKFTPGTSAGTATATTESYNGVGIALDSVNSQLYVATNPGLTGSLGKVSTAGVNAANFPISGLTTPAAANCLPNLTYVALDSASPANVWTAAALAVTPSFNYVCKFSSTGGLLASFSVPQNYPVTYALPHSIATDAGGNAWFDDKNQSILYKVYSTASGTVSTGGYTSLTSTTTMNGPDGVAVDGANSVWVSNVNNGSLSHFLNTSPASSLLPTYVTGAAAGGTLTGNVDYTFVTPDRSGNIWTTANNEGILVQYVGLGTPTVTPLSYARANGLVGAKPGLSVSLPTVFRYPSGDTYGTCPTNNTSLALAFATNVTFTANEYLTLSGFPTSTYLNGRVVQVCAVGGALGGNNLRVIFADGFAAPTLNPGSTITESGVASAVN